MPIGSTLRDGVRLYRKRGPGVVVLGALRRLAEGAATAGEVGAHHLGLLQAAAAYHAKTGTPLARCLRSARAGFEPETYAILGLGSTDPRPYVSRDARKYVGAAHPGPVMHLNGNARHVLHDKFAGYRLFDDLGEVFPDVFGTIHDGRYESFDGGASRSLLGAVEHYGTVVAKPADRAEGEGFYELSADGEYRLNGQPVPRAAIGRLQGRLESRNYLVTEYLHQHPYARGVFPHTANTIRLHTVLDPTTGDPFVVGPVHRFGTRRSQPVDTFVKGGVIAPIDEATGELRPLVVPDGALGRRRVDTHPDSGARITGTPVPTWGAVTELVLEGARSYPMARLIGWDVLVTEDGPRILEASGQPNPIGAQLERGLLSDERIARLFDLAGEPSDR